MSESKNHPSSKPWRLRTSERRTILILGDLLVAGLSLLIALYFWAQKDAWLKFSWEFLSTRPPFWYFLLPIIWMVMLIELYDVRRAASMGDTVKGILIACILSMLIYLIVYFSSDPNSLPRWGVAVFLIAVTCLTMLWRFLYIRIFTAPKFLRKVLIVGAGKAGCSLVKEIKSAKPSPFLLLGLIDDDPNKTTLDTEGYKVIGRSSDLLTIVKQLEITDIILAISGEMNPALFQELVEAEEQGIEVSTVPFVYEELFGRVPVMLLQSDWLLRSFFDQSHTNSFYEIAKRLFDIMGGIIGVVAMVILFPCIALSILISDGTPIIFKQERLGKNGSVYTITKFRTMRKDAEADGIARMASENDKRVIFLGKFLRKSHLDELPQFLNILKGEMSLVGPRAERKEFVDQLQKRIPFYRARLFVKPGLTGWAQVHQRYAATIEETEIKLEYDLFYIKERTFLLDLSILIRTIGAVIGLKGR
jgi:exopolysaccharide biosynthesis polyprenyl glycosylphosphotransferase